MQENPSFDDDLSEAIIDETIDEHSSDSGTVLRSLISATIIDFENILSGVIAAIVEPKKDDYIGLFDLYATAGLMEWALWKAKGESMVSPDLKEFTAYVKEERLSLEDAEARIHIMLCDLKGIEIGFDGFLSEFVQEIEASTISYEKKVQMLTGLSGDGGEFLLEETLMLRDSIGFLLQYLTIRQTVNKDFPFEMDIFPQIMRVRRSDVLLRADLQRLAKKYNCTELDTCCPENFWWRTL